MPHIFLLMTWAFVVFSAYIQRNVSIVVCLNHTFDTVRSRKADHPTFCLHSNLHYMRDAIINDHSEGHSLGDDRPSVTMNVLRSELSHQLWELLSLPKVYRTLLLQPLFYLIFGSINMRSWLFFLTQRMNDTAQGLPRRYFF